MQEMMVRAHILVNGIVQGVFFRFNTMRKATEFGITGWVKNRKDGRVEVLCEGPEDNVKLMVDWCTKGPEGSFVSNTEITWEEYAGEFETFQITY
jgi:acylphosphatase